MLKPAHPGQTSTSWPPPLVAIATRTLAWGPCNRDPVPGWGGVGIPRGVSLRLSARRKPPQRALLPGDAPVPRCPPPLPPRRPRPNPHPSPPTATVPILHNQAPNPGGHGPDLTAPQHCPHPADTGHHPPPTAALRARTSRPAPHRAPCPRPAPAQRHASSFRRAPPRPFARAPPLRASHAPASRAKPHRAQLYGRLGSREVEPPSGS